AASVGIVVVNYDTTAKIGAGSNIDSTAGVTVNATNKIGLQNLALAGGASLDGSAAVGGAIAVNVLDDVTTVASIASTTGSPTSVDATGAIAVTASSSLEPLVIDVPLIDSDPTFTSFAIAGSAGTSDAAVSGSVIVDVFNLITKAFIGDGAQINQSIGAGGGGQTLTVTASDITEIKNVAGAVGLTTGAAGIGVAVLVEVMNKTVDAHIGKSADVDTGGNVTITSTSSEDLLEIVASAGASSDTAGVSGSFAVVVLNKGGGSPGTRAYVGGGASPSDGTRVHAGGKLEIAASDSADKIQMFVGGLAFGSEAGVGVAAAVLVRDGTVDAAVGGNADLRAAGGTGVTVTATQDEDVFLLAIAGAGGGTAGVAGSATVDVLTNTTYAHIDDESSIASGTVDVKVAATDTTNILGLAGALAIGGSAGVGAGVDVEVVDKETLAWIGADTNVTTSGDVTVDAESSEKIVSLSVGGGFAGTAA